MSSFETCRLTVNSPSPKFCLRSFTHTAHPFSYLGITAANKSKGRRTGMNPLVLERMAGIASPFFGSRCQVLHDSITSIQVSMNIVGGVDALCLLTGRGADGILVDPNRVDPRGQQHAEHIKPPLKCSCPQTASAFFIGQCRVRNSSPTHHQLWPPIAAPFHFHSRSPSASLYLISFTGFTKPIPHHSPLFHCLNR